MNIIQRAVAAMSVLAPAEAKTLFTLPSDTFWPQDQQMVSVASISDRTAVTTDTAYGLPAYLAIVRVLSEDLAKIPLHVYERMPTGKMRAPNHPLYPVLHSVANPEMTSFVWRETSMGHLIGWGNCYSEIQRNNMGEVIALWPLRPDRVEVRRNDAGERFYRVRLNAEGDKTDLESRRVLHIPGLGYDGTVGYSFLTMMSRTIGLGLSAQAMAEGFWRNNARPGGVLTVPREVQMSDTAATRLRDAFAASHEGLSNAQRFAVLRDGITFTEIGMPLDNAQFLETRKFQVTEMARAARVPPHKIGDLTNATFTNIEHQAIEYVQDSLGVWCARWEQQMTKDLFAGGARFFAEFLLDSLLRGDAASRATALQIQRQNGIINGDEWRAIENMNEIEDGSGKDYWRPLNFTTGADAVPAEPLPPLQVVKSASEERLEIAVASMADAYKSSFLRPTPDTNVTIAEGAIRVDVTSPPVTIAEGAFKVGITTPAITTPPVTIAAGAVQVSMSNPPTRKRVERDAKGAIVAVTEEPIDG